MCGAEVVDGRVGVDEAYGFCWSSAEVVGSLQFEGGWVRGGRRRVAARVPNSREVKVWDGGRGVVRPRGWGGIAAAGGGAFFGSEVSVDGWLGVVVDVDDDVCVMGEEEFSDWCVHWYGLDVSVLIAFVGGDDVLVVSHHDVGPLGRGEFVDRSR